MTVRVYWNFHKNCYSIVDTITGLVEGYADEVSLEDAVFHVNENGRDEVRETGVKNVHAWVRGEQADLGELDTEIQYNPEETDRFETKDGQEVEEAAAVHLSESVTAEGVVYA